MSNLNSYQREQLNEERSMSVYKRDDMIQKGRYRLSVQEQRAVLYAISKIKPEDTKETEYSFGLREFYRICGIKTDTYTATKKMLKELGDKSWWVKREDGRESLVRWFNTLDCDPNSDRVVFKFHERMMPFLLQVAEQGAFYTFFNLKYVLPMSSKHSPRLYEILKSYQKNNQQWYFEVDKLKKLMDCENYKNFNDFEKRALKPAVEEINKYTDICIAYDTKKEGRKVTRIVFYMDTKTLLEQAKVEDEIDLALNGQLSFLADLEETKEGNKTDFVLQRAAAHREERGED